MKFSSMVSTAAATFTLALACVLPAQAQSVSGQGTWETTLLGRDINRNAVAATDASAVYLYDTTLNVTWLRDAFALGYGDWNTVNNRAANLTTGSGGNTISDWRLPTMTDTGTPGCNYSSNGTDCGFHSNGEMASLFSTTLGNVSYRDTNDVVQAVYGLTNIGSFQNMQSKVYWLGTELAPDTRNAWYFNTSGGNQGFSGKTYLYYAMAVRLGDVMAPVPEPETYAMLLAGLAVVGAISRRRARAVAALAT